MIPFVRLPRWCRECGHEGHAARGCLYRMTQHQVIQLLARGRPLPADLRCRCEAPNVTEARAEPGPRP